MSVHSCSPFFVGLSHLPGHSSGAAFPGGRGRFPDFSGNLSREEFFPGGLPEHEELNEEIEALYA